jgi:opacity protein-like surface antigen
MKKILIAAIAAAAFAAPQAFAQANNFEGFSLGASLNMNSSKYDGLSTAPGFSASENASSTSTNIGLQGQYTFALGNTFTLGLGLSYALSDATAGQYRVDGSTLDIKNMNSVFLAPGYALNDAALLYVKLGAVNTKLSHRNASVDMSGTAMGIGAQFMSGKNLFYSLELVQNNFTDKTETFSSGATAQYKLSDTVLGLGVGYKF